MASTLDDVALVVLAAGLLIKVCHLAHRPHDRSLGAVVACFVLVGLAAQVGRWVPGELVLLQYVLLLCGCFAIATGLAGRGPGRSPVLLAAAVAATLTFGLLEPPWSAAMHVVACSYAACLLVRAARGALRLVRSADTGRTQAAGIAVATAGLCVMAAGASVLVVAATTVLLGAPLPAWPGRLGASALLVGMPVVVAGICHPSLVMRRRALALWLRRCREYRRLGPLWRLLATTFPHQPLRRGPGALLRVSRAHRRRRVECRDGLVRLSPHVPDVLAAPTVAGPGGPAVRALAGWMLDHCGDGPRELPGRPTAKPLLVPRSGCPADDLALLLALSDAIGDGRRRPGARGDRRVSLPAPG